MYFGAFQYRINQDYNFWAKEAPNRQIILVEGIGNWQEGAVDAEGYQHLVQAMPSAAVELRPDHRVASPADTLFEGAAKNGDVIGCEPCAGEMKLAQEKGSLGIRSSRL